MNIKNKHAFTLVEVLITALISTVVFAGVYSAYIVGNRAWIHYNDSIAARREVRRALLTMVNDLRGAENVRVIQGKNSSAVYFYIPMKGPSSFVWNAEGKEANRIIQRNRARKRILAQNVSNLDFHYHKDAVTIDITGSKKTSDGRIMSAALKEKVALRSKTPFFQ